MDSQSSDDDDKLYVLLGSFRSALQWARENEKLGSGSASPFVRNVVHIGGRWDAQRLRATTRMPEVIKLHDFNPGNYEMEELEFHLDNCRYRAERFQEARRKGGNPT